VTTAAAPAFDGPLRRLPRNREDVYATFGDPGKAEPDPRWVKANIVTVRDLPGVPSKWYFECHKLAEPYIREGFRRAAAAAPDYKIERAASFVFRHQRHDVRRPLSYHSFGMAVDVDPARNRSITFRRLEDQPKPFDAAWRKLYPQGLPQAFVEAFESVGFAWGGRWRLFVDPMHFELVGRSDAQV
jgi:hypothetical protein